MPAIPYLAGNEAPTAARTNTVFDELDRKLAKILGGRSFILAFATAQRNFLDPSVNVTVVPWQLLGRCFFFLDPDAYVKYADRVPGFLQTNAPLTASEGFKGRSYNHAMFVAAVAVHANPTYHAAERIVDVDAFVAGAYQGLPQYPFTSLLDYSLQAHTITHEGTAYFVRERISPATAQPPGWNTLPAPEKHYDYALAEIILEGQTAVEFPASWDKYKCFRVHNLNEVPATVTFKNGAATVYTLSLPAFACQTLRRDSPTENYRLGGKYFFQYEAGDPRFFWFHPTSYHEDAETHYNVRVPDQPHVSNSMVANNLTNPAIAWDWLNALTGQSQDRHAWLEEDPHEVYDARPLIAAAFGDPANGSTKLGDLLHHKGVLKIVKTHKTDPLAPPILDTVEFKGYASIVADFAAKGIEVTVLAGNLQMRVVDSTHHWDLYSTQSNLLKVGEAIPFSVRLTGGYRTIEAAIFDNQATTPTLATTSPPLVWPRTVSEAANPATYRTYNAATGLYTDTTDAGDPIKTLIKLDASQAARKVFSGVHTKSVADLLAMEYFGKTGLASQDTDYYQIANPSLILTPHGLVLRYTERFAANVLPSLIHNYYYEDEYGLVPLKLVGDLSSGWFEARKAIRFRGHGWGYSQPGYHCTGFWVPRYSRYPGNQTAYLREIWGADGQDFGVRSPGTGVGAQKLLSRLDVGLLTCEQYHQRFWTVKPILVPEQKTLTLPLLPEHYNALAAAINARKTGRPLDPTCIRIDFGGGLIDYLNPNPFSGVGLADARAPVPMDCYDLVTTGSPKALWYQALGVTLRAEADLPASHATCKAAYNLDQLFDIPVTESLANRALTYHVAHPFPGAYTWHEMSWSADVTLALGDITNVRTEAMESSPYAGAATVGFYGVGSLGVQLDYCYTNIKWVDWYDFKLAWEAAYPDWPFAWRELSKPYVLELLTNSPTPAYSSFAVRSGTFAGVPVYDGVLTEMPGSSSFAAFTVPGSLTNPIATFTLRHPYQVIAFRPARHDDTPDWKLPVATNAPNDLWCHKNRLDYNPDSLTAALTWSNTMYKDATWSQDYDHRQGGAGWIKYFPAASYDHTTSNEDWQTFTGATANAIAAAPPVIAVEFTGGDLSMVDRFLAFMGNEVATLAVRLEGETGTVFGVRSYQCPVGFWSGAQDVFASTLAAQLGIEGPNDFVSTIQNGWPLTHTNLVKVWRNQHMASPRMVEVIDAGVTILEAPGRSEAFPFGTKYKCIWELGDMISLA